MTDAKIDAKIDGTTAARADATTDARVDANRALWNEWTAVHEASAFYDLAAFKAGRDTLRPLEVAELGDVSGKTLLHLMCHFGQDTLCWARRGPGSPAPTSPTRRSTSPARSYADSTTVCANTVSYQWDHTLGEIVCALVDAGLGIEFLHEWPFSVYRRWPSMVEEKDGWWYLPGRRDVPLSFSLRAHKPAR